MTADVIEPEGHFDDGLSMISIVFHFSGGATNWSPQLCELLAEFDRTAEVHMAHVDAAIAAKALVPEDIGKVMARQVHAGSRCQWPDCN